MKTLFSFGLGTLFCWNLTVTTLPAQPVGNNPHAGLAALVKVLEDSSDTGLQIDLVRGIQQGLKGQRGVHMPVGWDRIESRLGQSENATLKALIQSVSLTFGSVKALGQLRSQLNDPVIHLDIRHQALESLRNARDPELVPVLYQLIGQPDLRGSALKALASYENSETGEKILSVYPSFSANDKKDALNTLASRASFARSLLSAVQTKKIPATDVTADVIRQLRSLKNPELDKQVAAVWGTFRESSADKKKEIEKFKRIYRAGGSQPGDALRGRAVFNRICLQCHTLYDVGGKVGPDLTGSNRGDLDYILENMVDPNAVMPNDYRSSTIETTDDRVITGIVKEQNDKSVTILTANERIVVPRSEIRSLTQGELSMMPEGLLEPLTEQELRDLIYYLSRPGQVPLPKE